MRDEVQRYRMTFKCNDCQRVFKKVTSNVNLQSAPCPDCKTKNKKLKLFKVGDGPIPSTEPTTPRAVPQVFPNTIYKCKACDRVTKIYEDVGETALTACPACDSPEIQYRGKISHDVPSSSGNSIKAIDMTAEIVMQDYKISDLKSDVRPGESMAPKLDPGRQMVADNMFGNKKRQMAAIDVAKGRIVPVEGGFNMGRAVRSAMAGSLRADGIDPVARISPAHKPRVIIEAGDGVNGAKAR